MPQGRRKSENSELGLGKQIWRQEDTWEKWSTRGRISMTVAHCMQAHSTFHLIKQAERTSRLYLQGGCMWIRMKEECLSGKTVTHSSRN